MMLLALGLNSCNKQLNQTPKYGLNAEAVYSDPNNYINVLAKLYSGLSMTGNKGPAGMLTYLESTKVFRRMFAYFGTFKNYQLTKQFVVGMTQEFQI